jgi:hypothetical protein
MLSGVRIAWNTRYGIPALLFDSCISFAACLRFAADLIGLSRFTVLVHRFFSMITPGAAFRFAKKCKKCARRKPAALLVVILIMEAKKDVLAYVARMMDISRGKASELTGLANDAVEEVLDPEHIIDQSPDRDAVLEKEEHQVNLDRIAARLHVPVSELTSWVEDEMIFIQYGDNLSEGVASEGPTALSEPPIFTAAGTMT